MIFVEQFFYILKNTVFLCRGRDRSRDLRSPRQNFEKSVEEKMETKTASYCDSNDA